MEKKYKEWSKLLLEPTALNDARLYSMETRIESEEEARIQEYDFIKNLIKKIVYSLEQLSVLNIDR
jgi:hypothetical protein